MTDPVLQPGAPLPPRKMNPWLKWTLVGCGGLLLLVLIAALVAGLWWRQNSGPIRAGMEAATDSGRAYAANVDQAACVAEGRQRAEENGGIRQAVVNRLFVSACLEEAAPSPGLCDAVPSSSGIVESTRWQRRECGDNQGCIVALQALQEFCEGGGRVDADGAGDDPGP
jgi:hypothetical protein